ncbi:MAG: spore coat protein CotH [Firmicutes bacterium]|nr:spore coat protein CotH [Bacillota bacterium]
MSTSRHIEKICCIALTVVVLLTAVMMNAEKFGINSSQNVMGYENRIFDDTRVHKINIVMDNWQDFISTCENEEYSECTVVIDDETYKNVAIRAKGNSSLRTVAQSDSDRYSFKIEFDHYDSTKNYYGLDKLVLNNIIQDNTYVKDYIVYKMMRDFGVDAPLCSFVYISVNGEDWGLYQAVEGVEESFLARSYGNDYGNLYKPDSSNMPGEMNGKDMREKRPPENENVPKPVESAEIEGEETGSPPNQTFGGRAKGGPGFMGSDDVSLVYTDDDHDSYSNIFESAKTKINKADKNRLINSLKVLNEGSEADDVLDVEKVIRYFVVHNFVCNFDSYTGSMVHNYYLYEKDGILSMIPWDYNLAFSSFMSNMSATELVNFPIDSPVSGGTTESRPMLSWIFENEIYTELYHQYFRQFIYEYFESGYFEELMNSTMSIISPYVEKDPTKFCSYSDFETGMNTLKEFCLLRAESILGQLEGSVPSTSDEQLKEPSLLVEASHISISDMGNFGGFGGQRNFESGNEPNFERKDFSENTAQNEFYGQMQNSNETEKFDLENTASESRAQKDAMTHPNRNMNGRMPENFPQIEMEQGMAPSISNEFLTTLIVSAAILLFGLVFAFRFRR